MSCPLHPQWPHLREDCPFCDFERPSRIITGGQFWEREPGAPPKPVGNDVSREPDAWICRRVADYPGARVPAGGAVAACSDCGAPIVFNPARTVSAKKYCMQCSGIRPLPIDS